MRYRIVWALWPPPAAVSEGPLGPAAHFLFDPQRWDELHSKGYALRTWALFYPKRCLLTRGIHWLCLPPSLWPQGEMYVTSAALGGPRSLAFERWVNNHFNFFWYFGGLDSPISKGAEMSHGGDLHSTWPSLITNQGLQKRGHSHFHMADTCMDGRFDREGDLGSLELQSVCSWIFPLFCVNLLCLILFILKLQCFMEMLRGQTFVIVE